MPKYVLDDPSLAAVFDEKGADEVWQEVSVPTIGELIDSDESRVMGILIVDADATLLEVAAHMSQERALVAVVRAPKGEVPKFVTLPAVLDAVLHLGFSASNSDVSNPHA